MKFLALIDYILLLLFFSFIGFVFAYTAITDFGSLPYAGILIGFKGIFSNFMFISLFLRLFYFGEEVYGLSFGSIFSKSRFIIILFSLLVGGNYLFIFTNTSGVGLSYFLNPLVIFWIFLDVLGSFSLVSICMYAIFVFLKQKNFRSSVLLTTSGLFLIWIPTNWFSYLVEFNRNINLVFYIHAAILLVGYTIIGTKIIQTVDFHNRGIDENSYKLLFPKRFKTLNYYFNSKSINLAAEVIISIEFAKFFFFWIFALLVNNIEQFSVFREFYLTPIIDNIYTQILAFSALVYVGTMNKYTLFYKIILGTMTAFVILGMIIQLPKNISLRTFSCNQGYVFTYEYGWYENREYYYASYPKNPFFVERFYIVRKNQDGSCDYLKTPFG